MSRTLEILYVGGRHRDEVEEISARGAVVHEVFSFYDGIVHLKRTGVGAAIVEYAEIEPSPEEALETLRDAARDRPILVSLTAEQWEQARARGLLAPDEALLRPFYPDELWRRITRTVMPPPAKAVTAFRNEAERLGALINDAQRLNRFTNDLRAFADHCVAIVKARLRAARVSLFLKSKREGELTAVEAAGLDRDVKQEALVRLGEGVAGELAERREVVVVKEAGRDGPAAERDYAQHQHHRQEPLHDTPPLQERGPPGRVRDWAPLPAC